MMKNMIFALLVITCALHVNAEQPPEIGKWDRLWAKWDGIDPEVYVMMSGMDKLMTDMIQKASIAKEAKKEGEFNEWIKEKISDKIVEAATDYNPAVTPIKKMHEYAMKGTKSWLDWGMRKNVDLVYKRYIKELTKAKDIRKAMDATRLWLTDAKETFMNNKIQRELKVISDNQELLLAYIYMNHRKYHPEVYKDISTTNIKATRPYHSYKEKLPGDSWLGYWNMESIYPNVPEGSQKVWRWHFTVKRSGKNHHIVAHNGAKIIIQSITDKTLSFRFEDDLKTQIKISMTGKGKCQGTVFQPKNIDKYKNGQVKGGQ